MFLYIFSKNKGKLYTNIKKNTYNHNKLVCNCKSIIYDAYIFLLKNYVFQFITKYLLFLNLCH